MITASITLVTLILTIIWWYIKRLPPKNTSQLVHEAIAKEVITDNAVAANKRLDDWLRTLQNNKQ